MHKKPMIASIERKTDQNFSNTFSKSLFLFPRLPLGHLALKHGLRHLLSCLNSFSLTAKLDSSSHHTRFEKVNTSKINVKINQTVTFPPKVVIIAALNSKRMSFLPATTGLRSKRLSVFLWRFWSLLYSKIDH